jgi:type I restriction enzyme M protein
VLSPRVLSDESARNRKRSLNRIDVVGPWVHQQLVKAGWQHQLEQLCNLLLLKLEAIRRGRRSGRSRVFRPMESDAKTAGAIRRRYEQFVELYPEVFTVDHDKKIRFTNETTAACVEQLWGLKLIDLGVDDLARISGASQRNAQAGGRAYFTPQLVIEAAGRLMDIKWEDIIIDPACGTGGFLVEAMMEMARNCPGIAPGELSRRAQTTS